MEHKYNIIAFACLKWGYSAADLAGVSRFQYPPNIRIIRVMCSGRVDPSFVLKSLNKIAEIYPSEILFKLGLDIQSTTRYSFYDSMIIGSAIKGKCKKLYTEDLSNGHTIQGVTIVNPFE